MELVKNIILIVFLVIGVISIIKCYYPILCDILNVKKNGSKYKKNEVEEELTILKSSLDTAKKATAFVSLMSLSYVLVHTLINRGNNYDDQIQSAEFKRSLTPEIIKRLNALEGKYE